MTLQEFMKNNDFDRQKFAVNWNGFECYSVWNKRDEGAIVGYPQYALIRDDTIRLANLEEILKIMRYENTLNGDIDEEYEG